MKHFNYQELLNIKNSNRIKSLIIFCVSLVIYVALFISGIIISTYDNKRLVMMIFSIVLSLLSIELVILFVFGVFRNKKAAKTIVDVLNSYLFDVEGKITSISQNTITINNRKVNEITISDNNSNYIVYFDNEFGESPFIVNQTVKLRTASQFIVYYEVQDEEVSK